MRRPGVVLLALCGCGRIAFDPLGEAHEPWLRTVPSSASARLRAVADGAGGAIAALGFEVDATIDGTTYRQPVNTGAGVLRLGPGGVTRWVHQLQSGQHCDMRDTAIRPDGSVIVAGYTSGASLGTSNPCDVGVDLPQEPILLTYAEDGTFRSRVTFPTEGSNGQTFDVASYADGSLLVHGVYSGRININGQQLPDAPSDSTFTARIGGTTTWQHGLTSTGTIFPATVGLGAGGDACVVGYFDSPSMLYGVAASSVGSNDAYVARLRADGTPRFVRTFGSLTADNALGVVATADGGCIVVGLVTGEVDFGGAVGVRTSAGATDAVIAMFDASGAATEVVLLGTPGEETVRDIASNARGTFVAIAVSQPITIASTPITPAATDIVIVELTGVTPTRIVDVLGGSGDVSTYTLDGEGADLVVAGYFSGELTVRDQTASAATESGFVLLLSP